MRSTAYAGPLRDEPLAIELHNTLYVVRGASLDALGEPRSARAWLASLEERLPAGGAGRPPTADELVNLRVAVRETLHAAMDQRSPSRVHVDALNRASARAPHSPVARWRRDAPPLRGVDRHGASRADVVLSAFAADAIDLVTGPRRSELASCGAPGCVLLFLRDQRRREWCSTACGNRARQSRHYWRTRTSASH